MVVVVEVAKSVATFVVVAVVEAEVVVKAAIALAPHYAIT